MLKHELKEKLKDYNLETWRRHGKVLVRRDSKGRIIQWVTSKDLANIHDIPEVVIHPLKNFGVKSEKKPHFKRNKTKKKQISIRLSEDLVNFLEFLKGRKSLGTLIEELLREALKQYQTL